MGDQRPSSPYQRRRRSTLLLSALAVAVALVTAASQDRLLADDAYITFRYARNLASGHGLVYNPGELVLGTSTPLFAFLLAAGHRLGLNLADLAVWLGALSWAGVVAVLGWSYRDRPAWVAPPLLVLAASATFVENLGMESALYALLCLVALRLVGCGHTRAAAGLAAIAAVTRLDGGLAVVAVLAAAALRERRLPWPEAALVGLIAAPWYLYAWLTFGSPLPNSLPAKAGLAHRAGFGGGDFVHGGLTLAGARLGQWPVLAAYLGAAGIGLWVTARGPASGSAPWRPYVLWGGLYVLAYQLTGMPHFGWYYVPLVPLIAVLAIEGLQAIGDRPTQLRKAAVAIVVAAAVVAAGQMLSHSLRMAKLSPARALAYRDVGEWLASNARPGDCVALLEIGVVGYYSGLEVVDTMGLASPFLAERLVDWGQSLVLAVNYYWPEYLLALDATAWEAVERELWFALAYRPAAEFDYSAQGDPAARMRLYRRLPSYPPRAHTTWPVEASLRPEVQLERAGLRGLPALTPGTTASLLLTWKCLAQLDEDLTVSVSLRVPDGQEAIVAPERPPLRGGLPTRLWRPGEVITEAIPLVLPTDLPPGPAQLVVALGGSAVVAAEVTISPAAPELLALLEHPEPVAFGDEAPSVLGWTVHSGDYQPGGALDVTLGWRVPNRPPLNLSLFLHLVDAQEHPLAQWDGPPLGARDSASPSLEAVAETYSLDLPPDLPPGDYRLLMGLYNWRTGERLPLQSARTLPSGAVLLDTVTIGGPEGA
ncbi:MAG: hypothetical protein HPY83_00750 [Anaerolineae bacterium]|nr:hypothetical protein [Anaerolineae bacterium]